ncbi:hypothetical protein FQN57_004322, partial [Myotisia sp. PD_48]
SGVVDWSSSKPYQHYNISQQHTINLLQDDCNQLRQQLEATIQQKNVQIDYLHKAIRHWSTIHQRTRLEYACLNEELSNEKANHDITLNRLCEEMKRSSELRAQLIVARNMMKEDSEV